MSSAELALEAGTYIEKMVAKESRGWGDQGPAQRRLEVRYGLPFWSLEHLRTKKAKTCETSLYLRIKAAFIDHCGTQAAHLLREAENARRNRPDVHVSVAAIEDKIRALEVELAIAKSALQKQPTA